MKKESKKRQSFEQVSIKIPKYSPGHPPKNYNRKKAISLFCCLSFSCGPRCLELLTASITSRGDIYVMPFTEHASGDFHLSYHKSGKFHWTHRGNHIQPIYGEDDSPAAMRLWLKFKEPPCFCLRKGRNLNDEEIFMLLQRLAPNLPFAFDIEKVSCDLKDSNYRIFKASKSKE